MITRRTTPTITMNVNSELDLTTKTVTFTMRLGHTPTDALIVQFDSADARMIVAAQKVEIYLTEADTASIPSGTESVYVQLNITDANQHHWATGWRTIPVAENLIEVVSNND